jgi:hypothetical protein
MRPWMVRNVRRRSCSLQFVTPQSVSSAAFDLLHPLNGVSGRLRAGNSNPVSRAIETALRRSLQNQIGCFGSDGCPPPEPVAGLARLRGRGALASRRRAASRQRGATDIPRCHPGGSLTGSSFLLNTLTAKRLELLHELVPAVKVVGYLVNPTNPSSQSELTDVQVAARALGLQLIILNASNEREIDAAFANFSQQRIEAFFTGADIFFFNRREQIVALAARYAMPAIYHLHDFAADGGLMSYGTSLADAYRLAGVYAGRILKGEKPANLPVQQSVKVELVINLKTAKTLGLSSHSRCSAAPTR